MLDAIVSIKTFWIATSAPACFQTLSCHFLCKLCGTFKTFEQDLRLLVSTGTMNEVKTNGSLSARTSLLHLHLPSLTVLMRERMEKFKHFFITFLARAFAGGRVVVC